MPEAQPAPDPAPPRRQAPEGWTTPEGYTFTNLGTCRSCPQAIAWHKTRAGRPAPLNPDGTSHFANCPGADQHRRTHP